MTPDEEMNDDEHYFGYYFGYVQHKAHLRQVLSCISPSEVISLAETKVIAKKYIVLFTSI